MSELTDTLIAIRPLLDKAVVLSMPPDRSVPVTAGASLQAAIDAAPAGSTLALEAGTYIWAGPLTKDMAFTTKRALAPGVRATDADVAIVSPAGLLLYAAAAFRGIAHHCDDPSKNIVQALAGAFRLESGLILGSVTGGARRGLRPESDGGVVIDSTIDQCWQPDSEGQAVCGYDGGRNWLFQNSYFGGASQSLMFGGGDASRASMVPMNMRVKACDFGKDPNWFSKAWIKTAFELKAGIGIHLSDQTFQGAGTAGQQHGFLIVLKSLNQRGLAPWTQTSGVVIERFTAKQGAAAVGFVASDGDYPSVPLNNITIRDGVFSELDPWLYPGDARGALMFTNRAAAPATATKPAVTEAIMSDITLQNLVITGAHLNAAMYFVGPPPRRLVIQNVQLPQSQYGVKIEGSGIPALYTPAAIMAGIKKWAPDAIVEGITVV